VRATHGLGDRPRPGRPRHRHRANPR
jgi:hypothetical protein